MQQAEKRKAGRPLGSSNKKQYTSSARRAIEEAKRLLDGESFLDEEKDIENDSLDEGEVNDNPEDEDEIIDVVVMQTNTSKCLFFILFYLMQTGHCKD